MTVREATAADVPEMVTMGLRFIASSPYAVHLTPDPERMALVVERLVEDPRGLALVLEQRGGALVGMLGVMVDAHFLTGLPTMSELFWWAEPVARGHGLRLLRAAERWAKAQGAVVAQMIAPTEDVGRLYLRLGYEPLERSYQRSL